MLHYDRGLKLTEIDLAIDMRRRMPRGFISHAHADHVAKHELAFCTPETSLLYQHRHGKRSVHELPYLQTVEFGSTKLTTYPAGHVLGSAMLLADVRGQTLLYTGDFKLGPTLTAGEAQLPHADILVMESTYGDPAYRLPPRADSIERLVAVVNSVLAEGYTPVIHAYVLGKAQEVSCMLTTAGIPVQQHPVAYEISKIYEACGVALGDVKLYQGQALPGHAVVVPPAHQRGFRLAGLKQVRSISVTGWAHNPHGGYRQYVDHAIPLSDHADFDQLIACVEQVAPRVVLCTHGSPTFVDRLRERGFNAHVLAEDAHTLAKTW
ncbi:MAG TPA: MBL fold metallo-hydrolase RNA specificity domain-containing protein [Pirellulaceae bacterium]|nr:MBL fold metallo-hydrolase RNA specificity domain-containing protein [Pirellulaceae bacterium]